jgi:hypothetical protein
MGRIVFGLVFVAVFCFGLNRAGVADEQADLESKLLAIVKQQQALEQERRMLQKQLEETKAKSGGRVKIEVQGTLVPLKDGRLDGHAAFAAYGIRTNKGTVLVRLVRTEDKDHQLDSRLKSFEGSVVVVTGFLEHVYENAIDVDLHDEKQVSLLGVAKKRRIRPNQDAEADRLGRSFPIAGLLVVVVTGIAAGQVSLSFGLTVGRQSGDDGPRVDIQY